MSMACEARPMSPTPVPRPISAVRIGMPMATNEPKVSSSTTIAATIPIAVAASERRLLDLLDGLAAELDLRPRSSRRRGRPTTTCLTSSLGSSLARWSKLTVAKAMRPSAETARAPPRRTG